MGANPAHKYATLRRIGSKKAVRLYRLGEDYDLPALRERLEENRQRYAYDLSYQRYKPIPIQRPQPKRLRLNGSFSTVKKIGGFRGLYLHYCYCLGILPKNSTHKPLSPELREECRRLDAISRQTHLICREKLDIAEDKCRHVCRWKNGDGKKRHFCRHGQCQDGYDGKLPSY